MTNHIRNDILLYFSAHGLYELVGLLNRLMLNKTSNDKIIIKLFLLFKSLMLCPSYKL